MEDRENERIREAEAEFRAAVQREQAELMAAGAGRGEATEILLSRLRRGTNNGGTSPTTVGTNPATTRATTTTPPAGFSPAELAALVNDHGYSPEDAVRALTICHEIRLLQAAGVGGVAAAQELTRRVLDRREVVGGGGGGSAGGATVGAGGGSVGLGGSGGVAEICGGVSGGAGAEVDAGCNSGGGDAMPVKKFKSESLGGSGRRHVNKIWRSGRYPGADETPPSPKTLKSPGNGWDVHRGGKAGSGGMCGGGGGGGGGGAAGGSCAATGWPPRIAGRKRQHSVSIHGSGGGGAVNGQFNRGGTNGCVGGSEHGGVGDQRMFPAPSPSRPRAQGLLSREYGNMSADEATRVGDVVERRRGRTVSAIDASSAPPATRSTVPANSSALSASNAISSTHSAYSESGSQGADNEGGTGRCEASNGHGGSDHPQWNSGRSERGGNGRSGDDGSDMMDVTSPTIMPAAKRPRNHNGYNTTTTTIGSDGVGGLFQRDYPHIQQQRQQQQLLPGGVVGRGGEGVGDGMRESRPLVFVDQQRVPHQDEQQEQQLQHAFHRLGVRQQNAPPTPPRVASVQPKRPRGPGDDPSHLKRPRNG